MADEDYRDMGNFFPIRMCHKSNFKLEIEKTSLSKINLEIK
jgi:hypothetical protein